MKFEVRLEVDMAQTMSLFSQVNHCSVTQVERCSVTQVERYSVT